MQELNARARHGAQLSSTVFGSPCCPPDTETSATDDTDADALRAEVEVQLRAIFTKASLPHADPDATVLTAAEAAARTAASMLLDRVRPPHLDLSILPGPVAMRIQRMPPEGWALLQEFACAIHRGGIRAVAMETPLIARQVRPPMLHHGVAAGLGKLHVETLTLIGEVTPQLVHALTGYLPHLQSCLPAEVRPGPRADSLPGLCAAIAGAATADRQRETMLQVQKDNDVAWDALDAAVRAGEGAAIQRALEAVLAREPMMIRDEFDRNLQNVLKTTVQRGMARAAAAMVRIIAAYPRDRVDRQRALDVLLERRPLRDSPTRRATLPLPMPVFPESGGFLPQDTESRGAPLLYHLCEELHGLPTPDALQEVALRQYEALHHVLKEIASSVHITLKGKADIFASLGNIAVATDTAARAAMRRGHPGAAAYMLTAIDDCGALDYEKQRLRAALRIEVDEVLSALLQQANPAALWVRGTVAQLSPGRFGG